MNRENDLKFLADETSRPYEEGENPFERTQRDEEVEKMLINKYNLVLKEQEQ